MQLQEPTTTLFRCEWVTNVPGRCADGGTGVLAVLAPLDSFREGRLGEERVGLMIDDGGVMELWEVVSIVEEDLPETTSTLDDGLLEPVGDWKLAFDRRRSCLRNGMAEAVRVEARNFSPGEEPAASPQGRGVAAVIGGRVRSGTGERDRLRRVTTPLEKPRKNSTMGKLKGKKRENEWRERERERERRRMQKSRKKERKIKKKKSKSKAH